MSTDDSKVTPFARNTQLDQLRDMYAEKYEDLVDFYKDASHVILVIWIACIITLTVINMSINIVISQGNSRISEMMLHINDSKASDLAKSVIGTMHYASVLSIIMEFLYVFLIALVIFIIPKIQSIYMYVKKTTDQLKEPANRLDHYASLMEIMKNYEKYNKPFRLKNILTITWRN